MNVLVSSMHFSPAYIGHMKAWYKLCKLCNLNVWLLFDEKYKPFFDASDYNFSTKMDELICIRPDIAIVQNTGFENIVLFKWCKKNKCDIFYILHEPFMGLQEILKEKGYAVKIAIASILNFLLCKMSKKVIICSEEAEKNCSKYMQSIYKKTIRIPLLFLDEYEDVDIPREYFSMIGSYTESHGSDIFLSYIKKAYMHGDTTKFQIVTRNNLSDKLTDPVYEEMQNKGQLLICQGRPFTEEEMCEAYRKSFATWNGYIRSTQSGVLPNSFMQGTPVIATRLSAFEEFVIEGKTGEYIDDFDYETINDALQKIQINIEQMNEECRAFFEANFSYKGKRNVFNELLK